MQFNVEWLDINPYLTSRQQPVFMIERPLPESAQGKVNGGVFLTAQVARTGRWFVPVSPLADEVENLEWSDTHTGDFVRVPVFAYRTKERAIASIWGTGLQFGMRALDGLRRCVQTPVESCTLVLGHECHDTNDAFRCYVGMAFKMKE